MDISSVEGFRIALFFVVPGLVAVFARSFFTSGRLDGGTDSLISYFAISVTYWTCLMAAGVTPADVSAKGGIWFLVFGLLLPAVAGALLGFNARFDIIRGWLRKKAVNTVHPIANAWDWKFGKTEQGYVLVALTDGTYVRGYFGEHSFASSNPNERDLFLDSVYESPDGGTWIEVPGKEVLIMGSQIRYIEFMPNGKASE